MAGATQERRLLGVGSTAMFGSAWRGALLSPEVPCADTTDMPGNWNALTHWYRHYAHTCTLYVVARVEASNTVIPTSCLLW